MIRTEGLTKAFGKTGVSSLIAVDHLDLDIRPGEVFGFLGPNGAGKTTTVRMLQALIKKEWQEALKNPLLLFTTILLGVIFSGVPLLPLGVIGVLSSSISRRSWPARCSWRWWIFSCFISPPKCSSAKRSSRDGNDPLSFLSGNPSL